VHLPLARFESERDFRTCRFFSIASVKSGLPTCHPAPHLINAFRRVSVAFLIAAPRSMSDIHAMGVPAVVSDPPARLRLQRLVGKFTLLAALIYVWRRRGRVGPDGRDRAAPRVE
jgi:hypothetical protein